VCQLAQRRLAWQLLESAPVMNFSVTAALRTGFMGFALGLVLTLVAGYGASLLTRLP
jgi:hypothetical protein